MKLNRCNKIIEKMKSKNISQLIMTSPQDIFYATGHWLECGERLQALYINTDGRRMLMVNDIFANIEDDGRMEIISYNDNSDPVKLLCELINVDEIIGIDKNWASHFLMELIELKPAIKFINSSSIVDSIRMIKDDNEIMLLRNAGCTVDKVMEEIIKYIGKGVTEKQAVKELKEVFEKYGTFKFSFDPIIAYGANGADPHHSTSNVMPKLGDSVVIDIGGITDFYCSDITRTIFYGEPSDEAKKVYDIVLEANMRAIEIIKPGVLFSEIDDAARQYIEKCGYGEYFTHRTGHSIGIEDHEYPSVSSNNNMPVEAGMVFSVEPGIYLPGKLGVRIEDIIAVTPNGKELLNKAAKELRTINI